MIDDLILGCQVSGVSVQDIQLRLPFFLQFEWILYPTDPLFPPSIRLSRLAQQLQTADD